MSCSLSTANLRSSYKLDKMSSMALPERSGAPKRVAVSGVNLTEACEF